MVQGGRKIIHALRVAYLRVHLRVGRQHVEYGIASGLYWNATNHFLDIEKQDARSPWHVFPNLFNISARVVMLDATRTVNPQSLMLVQFCSRLIEQLVVPLLIDGPYFALANSKK